MSDVDLVVAPCSYQAAKYAVMRWHYSRAMPTPPIVRFGIWEGNEFIGAVLFGRGSNNNMLKPFGLKINEGGELVRVALGIHTAPVSKIVSVAIKALKSAQPSLRLLVSYADPNEGHHGGIYQAMNWVYSGKTSPDCYYLDSGGRRWHSRQVSHTGVKRQYGELRAVPKHSELTKISLVGKHRYLYPIDRAMRRQIAPLAQPYPKRDDMRPVNGDASATSGAGRFDSDPDAF